MNVTVFVEGGGNSPEQHSRCREGFHKLIDRTLGSRPLPRIESCGGRRQAFDKFLTAISRPESGRVYLLLVDSEDAVVGASLWDHLRRRGDWAKPAGAEEANLAVMATCMESWIVADRAALRQVFGSELQENALPPLHNLEARDRDAVQDAMVHATRTCGPTKSYKKGRRSFQVLAVLDPGTLRQHLRYFNDFETKLRALLALSG